MAAAKKTSMMMPALLKTFGWEVLFVSMVMMYYDCIMSKPIVHFENDWLRISYLPQVPIGTHYFSEKNKEVTSYKIFPQAGAIVTADDRTAKEIKGHGLIFKTLPRATMIEMSMADCPAITLIDESSRAVGILHLGLFGLYSGSVKTFIDRFLEHTQSKQNNLLIFIGPGICGQCFTLNGFKGWVRIGLFYFSCWRRYLGRNNKNFSFDIKEALLSELRTLGFLDEQVNLLDRCTYESLDFASHRRDGLRRKFTNLTVIEAK